jgi:hypothetical protein
MLATKQSVGYVIETLAKLSIKVEACKRGKFAGGVKVPVIFTDKRPFSVAVPETSTLSQLLGVTLHCMVPPLTKVRLPPIVSVPVGARVPSMVTTGVKGEVIVTAPLPVNVPDLYT